MKGLFFVLVWFVSLSPQTISWHCKSDYSCLSKSTLLQHHSIFSSFLRIKYSSSHLQKKTVPRAHLISAVFFFFRLTQTTQPGWKCAKYFLAAKTDMRSLRKSQRQSTPSQMFFISGCCSLLTYGADGAAFMLFPARLIHSGFKTV